MKQFYRLAVATLLSTAPVISFAETIITDEGMTFELDATSETASFIGLSGDAGAELSNLTIPAIISQNGKDYRVTALADNCCDNNPKLHKVILGENVLEVGDCAFRNCTGISQVTLNEGLKELGASSFYKCSSLASIDFPATLTSIGELAFYGSTSIQSITIPAATDHIGIGAFASCRSVQEFAVAEGNETFTVEEGVLFNKEKNNTLRISDWRFAYNLYHTFYNQDACAPQYAQ